jgi:hypothetical protein
MWRAAIRCRCSCSPDERDAFGCGPNVLTRQPQFVRRRTFEFVAAPRRQKYTFGMSHLTVLLTGFGVSIDAVAVAVSSGVTPTRRAALKMARRSKAGSPPSITGLTSDFSRSSDARWSARRSHTATPPQPTAFRRRRSRCSPCRRPGTGVVDVVASAPGAAVPERPPSSRPRRRRGEFGHPECDAHAYRGRPDDTRATARRRRSVGGLPARPTPSRPRDSPVSCHENPIRRPASGARPRRR